MKKVTFEVKYGDYGVTEALKTLRTNLQFCGNDKRVIMVTSCIKGEGKTETSIKLAYSLAEIKKKVLLLDLDLRKSVMINRVVATGVDAGMSHFLSGQAGIKEVIYATDIAGLHVAFAGPSVPNPTELLDDNRYRTMIDMLREIYDYIIIDTPPIGLVVDATIIGKNADGVILAMASGGVKYRMAQDVKVKLVNSGCQVLGVVLNKVDHKKNVHYYGKYYGNYYGSYCEDDEILLESSTSC